MYKSRIWQRSLSNNNKNDYIIKKLKHMKKLITFLTLLTLFFTTAWAEELTATLDMTTSQTSPVTVNGVTFSWNSNVVTGTYNYSGFKNSAEMTVTLPEGATLTQISKVNGSWEDGATITVYAGESYNGTPIVASIIQGTNSYNISSNNTGNKYFFENYSSKNAYIRNLSITYSISSTKYNVTCNENIDNGSISVNPTEFAEGSTVTITAEPNNGYKLNTVTVTPENGTAPDATINGNIATFIMPACNVEVDATFTETVTTHYKLVESADDLVAGAKYILAGKTENSTTYDALLGVITDNYGSIVTSGFSYDPSNNVLAVEDVYAATPLTLGGQMGAWTFHNGSGYLNLPSDGNYLNTVDEVGDLSKWIIVTSNLPSSTDLIQIQLKNTTLGTTKFRYLEYNSTGLRFAAYEDPLSPVALFKEVEANAVAASVTEIKALEDGTVFEYTGENLVVSGQGGRHLYAQDDNAGVHFFDAPINYNFKDIIPAGFIATKTTHNGALELVNIQNMSEATDTGVLPVVELTPADVTQNNPFIYALIRNALIEKPGEFFTINANGSTVSLQEAFDVETPIVGRTYNIYGVTNWNGDPRFMPLSYEVEGLHNITCKAFTDIPLHDGTYKEGGGTVVAKFNGTTVDKACSGEVITLDIVPKSGYTFSSVTVNGEVITPENGVYSFVMPDEDVEVNANFVASGYPITVVSSDGEHHGTYNGPNFATVGETVNFTITDLAEGYSVMGVSATFINKNGGTTSVTVTKENGVYSFGMPPFPVTIKVHYSHHLLVSGDWNLVTNASQLEAGHKYIIVHQDSENPSAMSTTQNRNNRGTTGIELKEENTIATITNEDTQVFTLEGNASGWYFNAGNGYLYAASSANNWLRTGHQKNNDAKATISLENGIASIVFQGSNTHNDLRYNPNSNGEPLFSCYLGTSELPKVSLYTRGEFNPGELETLNPPEFWPDPSELQPEGFYVELWTEYEDMGAIYYMLDPTTAPTQTIDVINNGKRCDYGYGWGDFYVSGPGPHHIYAVVEVEYEGRKYYSKIIAHEVYNTYALGDWKLLTNTRDLFVGQYEYIIVNDDFDKAVGSYDETNKRFNAVPCNENNNVVFDPSFETATVNSEDVKIFSLEFVQGSGTWREGYLYDTGGYYYHGTGPMSYYEEQYPPTIVRTQEPQKPEDLVWAYNGGYTGYVYLEHDNSNIVYNIDKGYFDCYNWNYPLKTDPDQRTKIRMYYRAKPISLADLCRSGNVRGEYTISDELIAVACAEDDWGNVYLWCKDQGNASINPSLIDPNNLPEGMEDFMMVHEGGFEGSEWDQSNWIALRFSNGGYRGGTSDLYNTIKDYVGWKLKTKTVKGVYVDKNNYQLDVTTTNLETSGNLGYTLNRYSPANFLTSNHNGNATGHAADGITPLGKHYFFMNPKIQEVCEITFAVWNGNYFVLPDRETGNASNIYGAFYVDWIFNNMYAENPETGEVLYDLYDDLVVGAAYKFKAIVQKPAIIKKSGAPSLRDGETTGHTPGNYDPDWSNYIVYPFDFSPEENIITGIETMNFNVGNGEVKSVKYVNVAGIVSDRPFDGVNIVVTEYTDGSRTTTKMIRK
jgi:hypothetical protein